MIAKIVDKITFDNSTKSIVNIYNTSSFLELNRNKVEDLLYIIVYKGESPRFAVVFGEKKDGNVYCPFSAPFGFIESLKKKQSVQNYYLAINCIEQCLKERGYNKVILYLPVEFYDKDVINTWYNIMINTGWEIDFCDINFAVNLDDVKGDYNGILLSNARKNLKIARKQGFVLKECKTETEKLEAYEIIRQNREAMGYPLRMTSDDVLRTMDVVPSKMYTLQADEIKIAASLVYEVTNKVAQVIYWGDIPKYREKKAINYLAFCLSKIYADRDFKYLDIGISTDEGTPNYGLCDFKDSIGCERTVKYHMSKVLMQEEN